MYPTIGSARVMRSPSRVIRSRRTPCVDGCCGPMLSTMSAVARPPAPIPTVSAVLPAGAVPAGSVPSGGTTPVILARHPPDRSDRSRSIEPHRSRRGRACVTCWRHGSDGDAERPGRRAVRPAGRAVVVAVAAPGRGPTGHRLRSARAVDRPRRRARRGPRDGLAVDRRRRARRCGGMGLVGHRAAGAVVGVRRAGGRPAGPPRADVAHRRRRAVRPHAVRRRLRRRRRPDVRARQGAAAHRLRAERRLHPRPRPPGGRTSARPAGLPRRGAAGGTVTDVPPPPPVAAVGIADGTWHRVHPLTPAVRSWQIIAVLLVVVLQDTGQNVVRQATGTGAGGPGGPGDGIPWLGAGAIALVVGALLIALLLALSWRMTRYRVTAEALELQHGVVVRRQRRARLDRLQAVEIGRA